MPDFSTSEIAMAISELYGIDAGKHRNSPEYEGVLTAARAVNELVGAYYSRTTPLTQPDLDALRGVYADLDAACEKYAKDKGVSRHSGYGEARLHCVNEISRIAKLDYNALRSQSGLGHHLSDVISCARATTVALNGRDQISAVGDALSSRIPLNIVGSHQQRDGFFTAEKPLSAESEIDDLTERYITHLELQPFWDRLKTDPAGTYSIISGVYQRLVIGLSEQLESIGINAGIENCQDILSGDLISVAEQFAEKGYDTAAIHTWLINETKNWAPTLYSAIGETGFNPATLDDQKAETLLEMIDDTFQDMRAFSINACDASIPVGQDISKRNIGMSRVADMIGLSGLVARTDSMKVEVGGEFKRGVFMEKATGSDLGRLKEDDPLMTCTVDERSVNTGELKKALADLQVLDYLCGNIDRHSGNMLWQTSDSNGHANVTGIMGIDNDCSFGVIMGDEDEPRKWGVVPNDMKVMSKKTAAAIMALEPDNLKMALQDMGFTTGDDAHPGEMEALASRLQALKDYISTKSIDVDYMVGIEPVEDHILLLDDQQFGAVDIEALTKDPKNPDERARNYFTRALEMTEDIPEIRAERQKELAEAARTGEDAKKNKAISYTATEKRWDYSLDRGELSLENMEDAAEAVSALQKRLKDADPFYHVNSGSFKWMKEALSKLDKKTTEYAERAQKEGKSGKLTPDEAKELEELYREVNKAAANYYSQHEGERQTDLGTARQDLSADLFALRPPYNDKPAAAAKAPAAAHDKKKVPYRTMVAAPSRSSQREHKSASKAGSLDAHTPDVPGSK